MKRLIVLMLTFLVAPVAGLDDPGANMVSGRQGAGRFPHGCYWYFGPPQVIQAGGDGLGEALASISNLGRRQDFAEDWLRFSKQSVARSLDFQKQWIELQKEYLRFESEMELLRLERLKLEAEIERLCVERLRLEKEKLELQKDTSKRGRQKTPEMGLAAAKDVHEIQSNE